MRKELEEYLREFKEKKDENGVPLVHFPSNFDSIVDAMSRKDLNSNEAKWDHLFLSCSSSSLIAHGANIFFNQNLMNWKVILLKKAVTSIIHSYMTLSN